MAMVGGSVSTTGLSTTLEEPSRKRRRSREPNWHDFYRNGLPKEVIVIEDTPEPKPAANISQKLTNGYLPTTVGCSSTGLNNHDAAALPPPPPPPPLSSSTSRKRRREDQETGPYLNYQIQSLGSHTNTSIGTQSTSSTNSLPYNTVSTSLSSIGHGEDQRFTPPRRKRTRQQVANEAKRRDVHGLADGIFTYKPPPFPPKKVGDVRVRVIPDVRTQPVRSFVPPAHTDANNSTPMAKLQLMTMMATTSSYPMLNLQKDVRTHFICNILTHKR